MPAAAARVRRRALRPSHAGIAHQRDAMCARWRHAEVRAHFRLGFSLANWAAPRGSFRGKRRSLWRKARVRERLSLALDPLL